jgi:hypothetical protein
VRTIASLERDLLLLEEAHDTAQVETKLLREDLDRVIDVLTALIRKLDADAAKKTT